MYQFSFIHYLIPSFSGLFLEFLCTPLPSVCQPIFLSLADEIEAQHYSRLHAVQCQKQIMITKRGGENVSEIRKKYRRTVTAGGNQERENEKLESPARNRGLVCMSGDSPCI